MGAARSNPPTPEPVGGAGVWVNKLLVVKKGFNKYYYKYYSRPGGAGGCVVLVANLGPPGVPRVCPGGSPRGHLGEGAEQLPRRPGRGAGAGEF